MSKAAGKVKPSGNGKPAKVKPERKHKEVCEKKTHKHPQQVVREAAALKLQLDSLKKQRVERLSVWTGKDSKVDVSALDSAISTVEKAYELARTTLASAFGPRPVPFVLPMSVTMLTTGGAGILSAPLTINPSQSTEWTSLAALFDEYRCCSATLEYAIQAPAGALTTSGGTTFSPNTLFVLGWDPSDNNPLGSVRQGTELQQHTLKAPSMRYAGAAGSYSGVFEGLHRFHVQIAKYAQLNVFGQSTNDSPGQWKPTNNSTALAEGYLKPYCATLLGTLNDTAVSGILYLRVEFRCRQ